MAASWVMKPPAQASSAIPYADFSGTSHLLQMNMLMQPLRGWQI